MVAYARQGLARSGAGWTVASNVVSPAAALTFPAMAGGAGGTVTHFGLGTASTLVAGNLLFFGTVTPNLVVANGVTPILATGTTITQASSDGMTTAAANAFLLLLFNNTAWTNIGDAAGLLPSTVAGLLYGSLHTASPTEAGNQTSSEISYT